ncbi:MAG: hypothetical protein ACKVZJ_09575 [Phycisphaerales bacterium]
MIFLATINEKGAYLVEAWPLLEKGGVLVIFAALLGWLARAGIPRVIDAVEAMGIRFSESVEKMQAAHNATAEKMQATYIADMKEVRASHHAEQQATRDQSNEVLRENTRAFRDLELAIRNQRGPGDQGKKST